MLLNFRYRNHIKELAGVKANVENAISYQIKKLIFFSKEINSLIENNPPNFQYVVAPQFDYFVDALIKDYASLIEYYQSFVINSLIGNQKPMQKIQYNAINSQTDIKEYVKTSIKQYGIGKLNKINCENFDEEEYCRKFKKESAEIYQNCFVNYLKDNVQVGTLWVLNNFIKHNNVIRGYAPSVLLDNSNYKMPYIFIEDSFSTHLNQSFLKYIFSYQIKSIDNNQHDNKTYSGKEFYICYYINTHPIISIDGLDFIRFNNSVGITIPSILFSVYELIKFISKTYIEHNNGNVTEIKIYERYLKEVSTKELFTVKNIKCLNNMN